MNADPQPQHRSADSFQAMSRECLLGIGHFLKCPKLDCHCTCHVLDGEEAPE